MRLVGGDSELLVLQHLGDRDTLGVQEDGQVARVGAAQLQTRDNIALDALRGTNSVDPGVLEYKNSLQTYCIKLR